MTRHRHDERGSAALETVLVVPAFLLFLALAIALGRVHVARQHLEAAAADVARTASLARDAVTARMRADGTTADALRNNDLTCTDQTMSADLTGFQTPPGTPASVAVTLTCRVPLADLALPGLPGSLQLTATGTSPLDTYRER